MMIPIIYPINTLKLTNKMFYSLNFHENIHLNNIVMLVVKKK